MCIDPNCLVILYTTYIQISMGYYMSKKIIWQLQEVGHHARDVVDPLTWWWFVDMSLWWCSCRSDWRVQTTRHYLILWYYYDTSLHSQIYKKSKHNKSQQHKVLRGLNFACISLCELCNSFGMWTGVCSYTRETRRLTAAVTTSRYRNSGSDGFSQQNFLASLSSGINCTIQLEADKWLYIRRRQKKIIITAHDANISTFFY